MRQELLISACDADLLHGRGAEAPSAGHACGQVALREPTADPAAPNCWVGAKRVDFEAVWLRAGRERASIDDTR